MGKRCERQNMELPRAGMINDAQPYMRILTQYQAGFKHQICPKVHKP